MRTSACFRGKLKNSPYISVLKIERYGTRLSQGYIGMEAPDNGLLTCACGINQNLKMCLLVDSIPNSQNLHKNYMDDSKENYK